MSTLALTSTSTHADAGRVCTAVHGPRPLGPRRLPGVLAAPPCGEDAGAWTREGAGRPPGPVLISLKLFGRSQLPRKFFNVSFTITYIKNKLTDLCEH